MARGRIYRNLTAVLLLSVMLSGCEKRPEGVLSDGEMVELMADMEIAEAYSQQQHRGSESVRQSRELGDGVLASHGVTRKELDATLEWYGSNMEKYDKLYEKVDARISEKRRKLGGKGSATEEKENSGEDMWRWPRHAMVTDRWGNGALSFSIDNPGLEKGEEVEWRMRFNVEMGGQGLLGVEYADGTSSYISQIHSGGRNYKMNLQTDTVREVRRLFGHIFNGSMGQTLRLDSIMLSHRKRAAGEYGNMRIQKRLTQPQRKKKSVIIQSDEDNVETHN